MKTSHYIFALCLIVGLPVAGWSAVMEDGAVRPVFFYIVDMSEFSADKLANRGSAQAVAILTNAQDFMMNLWNNLKP